MSQTIDFARLQRAAESADKRGRKRKLENLVAFDDTDLANAARMAKHFGHVLRFTTETGWLAHDGRRWARDPKGVRVTAFAKETARRIFDEIRDAPDRDAMYAHARRSQTKTAVQAMEYLARSEPGILTTIADFDTDPLVFNCANGLLDLRTETLHEHCPAQLVTKVSAVKYDSDADCETWDRFLARVTGGDQALYDYIRRLVGYLLTGSTREQVLHFLWGLGANGKSVFVEVLMALLGEYATVAAPELVMARRHGGIPNDVARLCGVRAVFMNETTAGARFDEARLKDLTGGDTLTGRFLHAEFFDFQPTHKLVIRGNHKPAIAGTDDGIWRRLRLIPFTVTIPPEERDPELLTKLKAELPGILRWAVRGCREWLTDGLRPPPVVLQAIAEYRDEADTLGRFIAECCTVRKLGQVKASEFQRAYAEFCRAADERGVPAKDLGHELERRGFQYHRTMHGRLYLGLELKTQLDTRFGGES